MNILKLFGLIETKLRKPSATELSRYNTLMDQYDRESAKRALKRIPTKEQLTKPIDYGIRNTN